MIIHIKELADPRVVMYSGLTEAQLRNRLHPDQAIFIAESPKVISVALDAGYQPLSILTEERHITGDAREIIPSIQEHANSWHSLPDTPLHAESCAQCDVRNPCHSHRSCSTMPAA